jgi:NAD(P)-dependent dehydrogenase (short-subunit alcohol dehydrogenase family)
MTLDNKVVLITGAKGGLGNFVTNAFLAAGARVVGVSKSIQNADFPNPKFSAIQVDLSAAGVAADLTNTVFAQLGKIDAVVHLVGAFTAGPPVDAPDDSILDRMMDVNFKSAFHMAQAALPHLRSGDGGHFLAIGSRAAVEPQAGISAYAASKAALVSLVRTIALENKDKGISANVVLPGTMDTPGNRSAMPGADFSKWVRPGEVANLLVCLASSQPGQINGAVIPVYGGEL